MKRLEELKCDSGFRTDSCRWKPPFSEKLAPLSCKVVVLVETLAKAGRDGLYTADIDYNNPTGFVRWVLAFSSRMSKLDDKSELAQRRANKSYSIPLLKNIMRRVLPHMCSIAHLPRVDVVGGLHERGAGTPGSTAGGGGSLDTVCLQSCAHIHHREPGLRPYPDRILRIVEARPGNRRERAASS